jgi:tRNA (guanine10-N2)-methyltransferase
VRQNFHFIDRKGKIQLKNPDVEAWVLLDYKRKDSGMDLGTESLPKVPTYFGRKLADWSKMKDMIRKYDLKTRNYIGPTSLDNELAFIMSNLSHVKKGSTVFDPFVGTGSILLALAKDAALCFGADIDIRVLKGEMHAGANREIEMKAPDRGASVKRGVFENFRDYGLPAPELIRMDNHLIDRHVRFMRDESLVTANSSGNSSSSSSSSSSSNNNSSNSKIDEDLDEAIFDAIVTDPPYGIRAGAKKSGGRKEVTYSITPDKRDDHIASLGNYPVQEV